MSVIETAINNQIQNCISFLRISESYFRRKNPIMNMVADTLNSIQAFMSTKQQLRALKYRVQLMNYRIYQMEQLIQQNNPHNYNGGHNLNQLR